MAWCNLVVFVFGSLIISSSLTTPQTRGRHLKDEDLFDALEHGSVCSVWPFEVVVWVVNSQHQRVLMNLLIYEFMNLSFL